MGYDSLGSDVGVLGLDEGSDLGVAVEDGAGADVGERADAHSLTDDREGDLGPSDGGPFPNLGVGDGDIRSDGGSGGDRRGSAEENVGIQGDVIGEIDIRLDPGGGRIDNGDPGPHPCGDDASVDLGIHTGQLYPVIDSLGLPDVVGTEGADATATGNLDGAIGSHGDDVGEVILALSVVVGQFGDAVTQGLGVKDVYAGVDLSNGPLSLVGVLVLDDPDDGLSVAEDASIASGIIDLGSEDGDEIATLAVDLDHLLEGFSGQHRDVTIGDDDLAVKLSQPLETTGDGVAGAFLLGLNSGGDVGGVIS